MNKKFKKKKNEKTTNVCEIKNIKINFSTTPFLKKNKN